MSHIDKPLSLALTVTRGKRAPFTVQPLEDVDLVVVEKALTAITNATNKKALDEIDSYARTIGISAAITNALNTRRQEVTE